MKIFKSVLVLSALLTMLVACGDESTTSSVIPEPADDSSSSVAPASSSSKKDENSSSSVEKAKESSSSVKPSSSSEAKSSSSEEVKQSSSSVVASSSSDEEESSSSEYVPYNHKRVLSSDSILSGAYKQFTDPRNGRSYYYLTINGEDKDGNPASVTVMAENLNVGEMVNGDKDQSNDSKIERYCYDNDTTQCDRYGGLYQWAEAMQLPSECNTKSCADLIKPNHQGICPDGWRLLTYDDFYIVVHADDNDAGAKGVRAIAFSGLNYTGYSLVGAGYLWNHEFENLNSSTYWFYPEEGTLDQPSALAGLQSKSSTANSNYSTYKTHGFSIRCVMVK
ncbi:MAG: hypothetical protein J6T54_03260 [Fibrobacter sp.]|nr:hypothetical protein [Fibrobacter sp.]